MHDLPPTRPPAWSVAACLWTRLRSRNPLPLAQMATKITTSPVARLPGNPFMSRHSQKVPVGLLLLCACSSGGAGKEPVEQRLAENLLLITIDTLRADYLGSYGAERPTPGIDGLAESGVIFESAWSASSWTLPSLATLMTGLHARSHGAISGKVGVGPELPLLAERAAGAGIRTWGVGSHIFNNERFGLQRGFEEYDSQLVRSYGRRNESHLQVSSRKLTDKAIAFLDEHGDGGRWLAWVHYFDPHNEYLPHIGFTEGDEPRDLYAGEVLFTDHHIRRLLQHLALKAYADVTAVVVVSDHGEEFGEHGGLMHRRTLYEEVLRVPLIVRAPGNTPGRVTTPVSMVDITPTCYELLDLVPPSGLAGQSLVPALYGEEIEDLPIVAEIEGLRNWDAIRVGRYKLIVDPDSDAHELYDLVADPGEQVDLASEDTERVAGLRKLLEDSLSVTVGEGSRIDLTDQDRANLKALGYGGDAEDDE